MELEIRIKNDGNSPALIDRDISIEEGNLLAYITYPDGKIEVELKIFFHLSLLVMPYAGKGFTLNWV